MVYSPWEPHAGEWQRQKNEFYGSNPATFLAQGLDYMIEATPDRAKKIQLAKEYEGLVGNPRYRTDASALAHAHGYTPSAMYRMSETGIPGLVTGRGKFHEVLRAERATSTPLQDRTLQRQQGGKYSIADPTKLARFGSYRFASVKKKR